MGGYFLIPYEKNKTANIKAKYSLRAPNWIQELIFVFSIAKYLLSISSQKLAKAASEKISRIFQLISKGGFVLLDFNKGINAKRAKPLA